MRVRAHTNSMMITPSRLVALLSALIVSAFAVAVPQQAEATDSRFFTRVSQWDQTFYPTVRDSFRESTTLYFNVDGSWHAPSHVLTDNGGEVYGSWKVTNSRGVAVRTGTSVGYGEVTWNGKNNAGQVVAPGNYTMRVTFVGEVWAGPDNYVPAEYVLSRPVTVAADTITRTWRVKRVPGDMSPHWDSAHATGNCRTKKLYRSVMLDCWGGRGSATASYSFWLPTRGHEVGAGPVRNIKIWFGGTRMCCRPGHVSKKYSHPRRHIYKGVVTVEGWRAYEIKSFNASYTYRKKR